MEAASWVGCVDIVVVLDNIGAYKLRSLFWSTSIMYILSFPNLIDNRFDPSYGSQSCMESRCVHDTLVRSIDGKPNFRE